MDFGDRSGQCRVVELTLRRRPVPPLVETLPRHAQHAAHERDRKSLLRSLGCEKGDAYWFWLAKEAAAFFRKSRSILPCWISLRSRCSSARSDTSRSGSLASPFSRAFATQRPNVASTIPRPLATQGYCVVENAD